MSKYKVNNNNMIWNNNQIINNNYMIIILINNNKIKCMISNNINNLLIYKKIWILMNIKLNNLNIYSVKVNKYLRIKLI